jgi:hypothetical protein
MDSGTTVEAANIARLEERAWEQFQPYSSGSPGFREVLRRSLHFVEIDDRARTLFINKRAIFLGILDVGAIFEPEWGYRTAANWYVGWLAARKDRFTNDPLTKDSPLQRLSVEQENYAIRMSTTMARVASQSVVYARSTIGRSGFDLRHLLAAMLNTGGSSGGAARRRQGRIHP